jgi:hypothetical protein
VLTTLAPENITILYADAFDVVFQGSRKKFIRQYERMNEMRDKVIYSVEHNCWPFKRHKVDDWYDCPSMLGPEYIQSLAGRDVEGSGGIDFSSSDVRPLGCKLQDDIAGRKNISFYLNSGLR